MVTPADAIRGRLGLILSLPPIWFRVGAFGDDRDGRTSAAAGQSPNLSELSFEELTAIKVDISYGTSNREQVVTEAPSVVSTVTKDLTGSELARPLRSADARRRGVYSSGYSPELAGRGISPAEGCNFLPRPHDIGRLAQFVRDVLDRTVGEDRIGLTVA